MAQERLVEELRRLSKLLSAAAASVEVIATQVEAGEPSAPVVAQPALSVTQEEPPAEEAAPPPWDAMVEKAVELLRADPGRSWRPAELARATRDAGIELSSLQGVHFGLTYRLRQLGAIEDGDAGFHASALLVVQPPTAPEPEEEVAPVAAKVRRELPWGQIVPAAMTLLRAEPDRVWGQSELVRAVRDSGVALDNL